MAVAGSLGCGSAAVALGGWPGPHLGRRRRPLTPRLAGAALVGRRRRFVTPRDSEILYRRRQMPKHHTAELPLSPPALSGPLTMRPHCERPAFLRRLLLPYPPSFFCALCPVPCSSLCSPLYVRPFSPLAPLAPPPPPLLSCLAPFLALSSALAPPRPLLCSRTPFSLLCSPFSSLAPLLSSHTPFSLGPPPPLNSPFGHGRTWSAAAAP